MGSPTEHIDMVKMHYPRNNHDYTWIIQDLNPMDFVPNRSFEVKDASESS